MVDVVDCLEVRVFHQRDFVETRHHLAHILEGGLQRAQSLHVGSGSEVFVTLEDRQAVDVFHRDDRLVEAPVGLSRGGHVALALGVEVPVTGLDYDYRLHAFLLWDFADGPFWRGW